MCGIAGFSLAPGDPVDAGELSRALLLGIESRGRHATGVAYVDGDCPVLHKAPITATNFVKKAAFGIPSEARVAILHTRYGTQGAATDNRNNHPIDVGGILGIHNGVVWNDRELFARLPDGTRIARVDSEAIFATLLHGGEPAVEALARVKGSASVAWLDTVGDPTVVHMSRVSMSPVVVVFTDAGSMVFASETAALLKAVGCAGMTVVGEPVRLVDGEYWQVQNGQVLSVERFEAESRTSQALSAVERAALNLDAEVASDGLLPA